MAAKLFSKQSLVTKLQSTILQSQSLELDTKVIVVNVVIGGFSGENQKWLAHVTVWLQVSDYSQLSDYTN